MLRGKIDPPLAPAKPHPSLAPQCLCPPHHIEHGGKRLFVGRLLCGGQAHRADPRWADTRPLRMLGGIDARPDEFLLVSSGHALCFLVAVHRYRPLLVSLVVLGARSLPRQALCLLCSEHNTDQPGPDASTPMAPTCQAVSLRSSTCASVKPNIHSVQSARPSRRRADRHAEAGRILTCPPPGGCRSDRPRVPFGRSHQPHPPISIQPAGASALPMVQLANLRQLPTQLDHCRLA